MTQPGSSPSTDSVISAAPVSALSAIGSAILPKSVTRPRLRASCPSRKSVSDAPPNAARAASRQPVPPCDEADDEDRDEADAGDREHVGDVDEPDGAASAGGHASRGVGCRRASAALTRRRGAALSR